jgi:hypothetical protein
MTDKGEIKVFLNWNIIRDRRARRIWISQKHYISRILEELNMIDEKRTYIPIKHEGTERVGLNHELTNEWPYKEVLGKLMYLMLGSRPDLCYAISYFSRYSTNFTSQHWKGLLNVIGYLGTTKDYLLELGGNKVSLSGGSDSSYGSLLEKGHSISGCYFKLGNSLISWYSKKQNTVALSSCEAEYMALSKSATEGIWLKNLLGDLGYQNQSPVVIYCDNKSTISISKNPVFHSRTKHIAIRHHFIREKIEENVIAVEYVKGIDNIADGFTKALPRATFEKFIENIGLIKKGFWNIYH